MDTSGNICTLYQLLNKQIFYQQILWLLLQTQQYHLLNVDGAIDIVKIKSAGSGGTDGTHTGIAIRGDGSSGTVSVTVSSGVVTAVTVTTPGYRLYFGYIRNADIVSAGATGLSGAELDVIIEPKGGHGENAIKELGGYYVMLNTNFEGQKLQTLVTLQQQMILDESH
jgi:hypothetical protein